MFLATFKARKNINKNNNKFYLPFLFSFFNDFLFYYSFYITYFSQNGFSGGKLATLIVIMNASKMMADIPVGILSDIISRRHILLLGLLCRAIFCGLCLFGQSLPLLAMAMLFVGIGNSCLWTHTWNYFYDYLKEQKKEAIFPQFMGKFYAVSNVAIALAGFTGSYIYTFVSFNGVFLISIASILISILIISMLPNYKPKTTIKTAKNLKIASPLQFISLLRELLKAPRLIRMLLLTILMDCMFIVFLDMNTTLMNHANMSAQATSRIVGIVAFVRIFSNYFSGKTEKLLSFKRIHSWLLILVTFGLIASFFHSTFEILAVSAYLCIYPFFDTSIKTKLQNKLDSNTRATVMSLASLFVSIFAIIFNSLIGIVAEQSGYFATPICIFLVVTIILWLVRNIIRIYRFDKFVRNLADKINNKNNTVSKKRKKAKKTSI